MSACSRCPRCHLAPPPHFSQRLMGCRVLHPTPQIVTCIRPPAGGSICHHQPNPRGVESTGGWQISRSLTPAPESASPSEVTRQTPRSSSQEITSLCLDCLLLCVTVRHARIVDLTHFEGMALPPCRCHCSLGYSLDMTGPPTLNAPAARVLCRTGMGKNNALSSMS